jgi:hypothetical protein
VRLESVDTDEGEHQDDEAAEIDELRRDEERLLGAVTRAQPRGYPRGHPDGTGRVAVASQ